MVDTIQAINIARDSLRDNLTDPYVTAGGNARAQWIFSDEPITSPKYPIVQLKKINNPVNILDIGTNYMEHEQIFINCWVQVKNGFKVTIDGTELTNAQLVEKLLYQIGDTLKNDQIAMQTLGVKGYKKINTSPVGYDPETQLYFAAITVRVWIFNR